MGKIFDFFKARTAKGQARLREREMMDRMEELLRRDEDTFKKGLQQLGLNPLDPEYQEALNVWRAYH